MIRFKHYLQENAESANAFAKAKFISKYFDDASRYKTKYLAALEGLEEAAKQKEIYNARMNEYKASVSSGIEFAYRKLSSKLEDEIRSSGIETYGIWSITSLTDISKVYKLYKSMSKKIPEALEFMDAIAGLPDAMKVVKTYLKKGVPPKEPKPGQFVKPLASSDAVKLSVQFMREAADSFTSQLKSDISDRMLSVYERIKGYTTPSQLSRSDSDEVQVATAIFVAKTENGKKILKLQPNSREKVEKLAADTSTEIIEGFIFKSSSKLALILQKKDKPKNHSIIKTNISNGMVENSMKFEFNDGSSFTMESSVVYKYSKTGTLFTQYPTRFKNVKLSDGSLMKAPSEEKMIKEF
jgi:dsDNA-binding SOS-regulon protein